MIIMMDSNEYVLHPLIVEGINKFLYKKQQKSDLIELYRENKIITKKLECGDYMFNNILIEHKTISDFCGSVTSGHIFQQSADMIYFREQNPEIKLFILISGSPEDILKLEHPVNPDAMIAAFASLNKSIPTSFMSNSYFFIAGMIDLFEKFVDGKIREYSPVRKPQEFDDIILSNYTSLVGEKTAKNLLKKFPIPKQLYNASKEQLLEVDKIGKGTAEFLVNFSEGREKSWKVIEERKKLLKENKLKLKEQKNPNEIIEQKDLSLPKFI